MRTMSTGHLTRSAGVSQTAIAITLLETVGMLISEVDAIDLADRAVPLRKQANLILAGCKAACPLPEDLEQVCAAARKAGFQLEGDCGAATTITPAQMES